MKRSHLTGWMISLVLTACSTPSIQSPNPGEARGPSAESFNAPTTGAKAVFIPHVEEKPMQAYLAMNLDDGPYKVILQKLEEAEHIQLKTRGEAHITVITPVEYDKVLKKHLSMAAITKIAEEAGIQSLGFTPVCVGKGQKELNGKLEKTYYVVVESQDLIDLRGRIEDAYVQNGGKEQDFVPERFMPHVTLGYTARDLHHEDGVHKDRNSCIYFFDK